MKPKRTSEYFAFQTGKFLESRIWSWSTPLINVIIEASLRLFDLNI